MPQWLTALLVGGIVGVGLAPIVLAFAWLPMRRKAADEEVTQQQRMQILRNTGLALLAIIIAVAVAFTMLRREPTNDATAGSIDGMLAANMPDGMPDANMPGSSSTDVALPSRLAGLPLSDELTGAQAVQQVASMHPSEIPVATAVVGSYKGDGHEATVWAAFTSAPEMAGAMSDQMSQAIATGNTPFGKPQQMADGVWKLEGMGQVHYFFHAGTGVWWVSADPSLAERSLDQVRTAAGL